MTVNQELPIMDSISILEKGKIVILVNHYKKWVEIIWQNEDGKFCSGWIQNYKVTKFK